MEDQVKLLSEQVKKLQDQLAVLQNKRAEEISTRQPINPAVVLTPEMNFEIWKRMVVEELTSLKYDDLLQEPITETVNVNYDMSNNQTKNRLNFVSTY